MKIKSRTVVLSSILSVVTLVYATWRPAPQTVNTLATSSQSKRVSHKKKLLSSRSLKTIKPLVNNYLDRLARFQIRNQTSHLMRDMAQNLARYFTGKVSEIDLLRYLHELNNRKESFAINSRAPKKIPGTISFTEDYCGISSQDNNSASENSTFATLDNKITNGATFSEIELVLSGERSLYQQFADRQLDERSFSFSVEDRTRMILESGQIPILNLNLTSLYVKESDKFRHGQKDMEIMDFALHIKEAIPYPIYVNLKTELTENSHLKLYQRVQNIFAEVGITQVNWVLPVEVLLADKHPERIRVDLVQGHFSQFAQSGEDRSGAVLRAVDERPIWVNLPVRSERTASAYLKRLAPFKKVVLHLSEGFVGSADAFCKGKISVRDYRQAPGRVFDLSYKQSASDKVLQFSLPEDEIPGYRLQRKVAFVVKVRKNPWIIKNGHRRDFRVEPFRDWSEEHTENLLDFDYSGTPGSQVRVPLPKRFATGNYSIGIQGRVGSFYSPISNIIDIHVN